ncbi:MAG: zinc-binding dehydrogenase [Sporichthyaceae bacterium]
MRAVLLKGPHQVAVEEIELVTDLAPDEVLLKVELTAICGTDLHPYEGRMELEADLRLGHEFLGSVVDVGAGVQLWSPGDRAVASCVVNCGFCHQCRRNQPGACAGARIFGLGLTTGDLDGGQAEYVRVPAADLAMRRIPEDGHGTDEDYLMVGDILTTGYEAIRAHYVPGDVVAIVGAGPVGLCAAMSAKALGAGTVVVIDKVAERLKEAEAIGAIGVNADETDPVDAVLDLTGWRGADLVVDAVGHPSALATAVRLPRMGGTLAIPGVYSDESLELPWGEIWFKGIKIFGGAANITRYMDEAMSLVAAGHLAPGRIVSHRMPLTSAPEAYRMFAAREALKIVLDPAL